MLSKKILSLLTAILLLAPIAPAAFASYYGGDFTTSPSTIVAGGNTNITLSIATSSAPTSGGGEVSCTGSSCVFTVSACTDASFQYMSVYQVRVGFGGTGSTAEDVYNTATTEYALGAGSGGSPTYDLAYPPSLGGPSTPPLRVTANGFGAAINISATDTLNIPFGAPTYPNSGSTFTLTTSLGSATYQWFPTTQPATSSTTTPTANVGTYAVDVEGVLVCSATPLAAGSGEFDAAFLFTTTPKASPSIATNLVPSSVVAGNTVTDTATITGGNNPTGTVTFYVYSGSDSSACGTTATAVATAAGSPITTSAPYTSSATFGSGLAAGSYEVQAFYSGDSHNNNATSTCGSEPLTVTPPSLATRTPGFWQTHTTFTEDVFATISPIVFTNGTVCKTISTNAELFAGFYASIPKTTTGEHRTTLDQQRMILLQQLLAAILNQAYFGSAPSSPTIAQAEAAYCGTSVTAISNAANALNTFNNSGDTLGSTPGAAATPQASKSLAATALSFWDQPSDVTPY